MNKLKQIISFIINKFRKEKTIIEKILSKNSDAKNIAENFLKSLESGFVDDSLYVLLKLMSLVFMVDKSFRRNIENFNGRYLFNSRDNKIEVSAIFKNGKLKVKDGSINNTNVIVTFKDVPSLMHFALSKDPNILNAVLDQTIVIEGNLNYIYKFGYMAQHLVTEIKNWFD